MAVLRGILPVPSHTELMATFHPRQKMELPGDSIPPYWEIPPRISNNTYSVPTIKRMAITMMGTISSQILQRVLQLTKNF